ncbi:hypothetical protein RJ641_008768 [Dillenia turbinata]|uniref:RING-type domain-containing protein n=1 Tax=Dillenia turbinata TaxID=194707 RepID=A0AAN8V8R2_9MAGN
MGFDNECILNIQSLAGEYFCPVCRLLVYPNEAMQSQCTHLYCKPCLTYVVSTTRACPYDGYLVTDADSKPLLETNTALAETIGKIAVHCLYHKSGCTWQGPLSDCSSHCSVCAFGNSPVMCNRCALQIVHRQVQEHAQNCPGVQSQVQMVEGAQEAAPRAVAATTDQSQASSQTVTPASQTQSSQVVAPSAQNPSHQSQSSVQSQPVGQAPVSTAEQWYQQQQLQYQQYYQQYPGYDPYQQQYQQYYPYQQQQSQQQPAQAQTLHAQGQHPTQVYAQPQIQTQPQTPSQAQPLLQPKPLPQTHVQSNPLPQPQNQVQVNQQLVHPAVPLQPQMASQPHPTPSGQLHPQQQPYMHAQSQPLQPHAHQYPQGPQQQQPPIQMQLPQTQVQPQQLPQLQPPHHPPPHSQTQPQPQLQQPQTQVQVQPQHSQPPHSVSQTSHLPVPAVTGHHSYPQPQLHQQMPPQQPPQQPPMFMHSQGGQVPQHPVQLQNQFAQPFPQMRPPNSQPPLPSQQQLANLPRGQVPPTQQHVLPHGSQPGHVVHQRPVQPPQQPAALQYSQQQSVQPFPMSGQNQLHHQGPFVQQQLPQPVQSQLLPQGPPNSYQPHPQAYLQPQQQNVVTSHHGEPMIPNHGFLSQPFQQSPAGVSVGGHVRPMQVSAGQVPANQNLSVRSNNQQQTSTEQPIHLAQPSHLASGGMLKSTFDKQADRMPEKGADEGEAGDSSVTAIRKDTNVVVAMSGDGNDSVKNKVLKSDNDSKPIGDENSQVTEVKYKTYQADASAKNPWAQDKAVGAKLEPSSGEKSVEATNSDKNGAINVDKKVDYSSSDAKENADAALVESPLQKVASLDEQSAKSRKEMVDAGGEVHMSAGGAQIVSQERNPLGPGFDDRSGFPVSGQVQGKVSMQSHGAYPNLQRPPSSAALPMPPLGSPHLPQLPGHPSSQLRPHGHNYSVFPAQPPLLSQPHGAFPTEIAHSGMPGQGTSLSFGGGAVNMAPSLSVPPSGQYNQVQLTRPQTGVPRFSQGEPPAGLPSGVFLPGSFDSLGGTARVPPQHPPNLAESDAFSNQRPAFVDGRQPDSHLPGSLDQMPFNQRPNGAPSLDSSVQGPRDDRFKPLPEERLSLFPMDSSRGCIGRGEFKEDLRKFHGPSHLDLEPGLKLGSYPPGPGDRVPHVFGRDGPPRHLDNEAGATSGPPRFLPPYHPGGASLRLNDVGDRNRPLGIHDDYVGLADSARRADFIAPGRGFSRPHMDGMAPRSPLRDYPSIGSHRFGGLPGGPRGEPYLDDFNSRDPHAFGEGSKAFNSPLDPVGNPIHKSRFPGLPGHLRRGELDGPPINHLRGGDMIGPDILPGHLRKSEVPGPHHLPGHLRFGEPAGFGNISGPARMGEFLGPGNFHESFGGKSNHLPPGDPVFRSSYSLHGYPNEGGFYAGDMESFEHSRKRKPPSMGWCRICKVDCETVEGLDLHSQTREHQKMAMDMVRSIKQQSKKKQKINQSSADDASKPRKAGLEGRGNKR